MIKNIRNLALVATAGLAFGGFMYLKGYNEGKWIGIESEQLRVAEIERARLEVTRDLQSQIDDLGMRQATIETQRQTATREVRLETERIIEKPVYRTVCVDADGLRVLDQAANIANGRLSDNLTASDDATGTIADRAPDDSQAEHMTGADCLMSLVDLYDFAGQTRAQLIALQAQINLTKAD